MSDMQPPWHPSAGVHFMAAVMWTGGSWSRHAPPVKPSMACTAGGHRTEEARDEGQGCAGMPGPERAAWRADRGREGAYFFGTRIPSPLTTS